MELVRDGDDILMRMEEYDAVRRFRMTDAAAGNERPSLHGTSRGRFDGATLVVTTKVDGRFSIPEVPAGAVTLRVAMIGYTPKSVTDVAIISKSAYA